MGGTSVIQHVCLYRNSWELSLCQHNPIITPGPFKNDVSPRIIRWVLFSVTCPSGRLGKRRLCDCEAGVAVRTSRRGPGQHAVHLQELEEVDPAAGGVPVRAAAASGAALLRVGAAGIRGEPGSLCLCVFDCMLVYLNETEFYGPMCLTPLSARRLLNCVFFAHHLQPVWWFKIHCINPLGWYPQQSMVYRRDICVHDHSHLAMGHTAAPRSLHTARIAKTYHQVSKYSLSVPVAKYGICMYSDISRSYCSYIEVFYRFYFVLSCISVITESYGWCRYTVWTV